MIHFLLTTQFSIVIEKIVNSYWDFLHEIEKLSLEILFEI